MGLVHGHGAEPALPEMPGPPLARVDGAGIGTMHSRQGAPETVRIQRHEDQMEVIGHQAPSPDLDIRRAALAAEEIAIIRIVGGAKKRPLPAIATLGDMVRDMGNDDPGEASHGRILAPRSTRVNFVHCHRNPGIPQMASPNPRHM